VPAEQNKAAARRFLEETDKGNLDVIDEQVSPDAVDHNPFPGQAPGAEGVRQVFAMLKAAFPDMSQSIQDMVAEGDRVAIRSTLHGTHRGEFLGIPATGKQVALPGIDIIRFDEEGKMIEHWGLFDVPLLMQQLGVMPGQ